MYRSGHVGAALLVYAPVGAALLALEATPLAVGGAVAMVGLAGLPDCDRRLPLVRHRGFTHTVPFALAVGGVLATAGIALGRTVDPTAAATLGGMGALVGTLSVLAHVAADALTPMGVRPFWPVSRRRYALGVTTAADPAANYLLLALGVGAVAGGFCLAGPPDPWQVAGTDPWHCRDAAKIVKRSAETAWRHVSVGTAWGHPFVIVWVTPRSNRN